MGIDIKKERETRKKIRKFDSLLHEFNKEVKEEIELIKNENEYLKNSMSKNDYYLKWSKIFNKYFSSEEDLYIFESYMPRSMQLIIKSLNLVEGLNRDDESIDTQEYLNHLQEVSNIVCNTDYIMNILLDEKKYYEFEAEIKKVPDIDGAYIEIPFDLRKEYGKGRLKVTATFDDVVYNGSIVNMGVKNIDESICYIIGVTKTIRAKLNKQIGDIISVTVQERN
jgi:hypothetical protein